MRFENPWILLGLLFCLVPVAIHLINRQRAKIRPFAAIEYLLLSDKRLARRLKLRQILVLLLRTALMAAIPLALAKPYLEDDAGPGGALSDPGAVVLVVDDSMSMQARHPGSPDDLLERARAAALDAIRSGGSRTSFAVVAAGKPARLLTPGLTYDRQTLERALDRLLPGPRAGDLAGALREAERVVSESGEPSRRVLVVGDQSAHAWKGVVEPWALAVPPWAETLDVRGGAQIPNLAVAGVRVVPATEVGPGQARVEVTVANHGAEPAKAPVRIDLGGEVSVSTLDVPARSSATLPVVVALPPGGARVRGEASLPPDDLDADNTWYFTVDFGGVVNVAVVNGAPRNVPHEDEVFFLRAALEAASAKDGRLHAAFLGPGDLDPKRLEHVDAVVLANVGPLSSAQAAALRSFVSAGGGLLATAGDQLTPDASRTWGDLLPLPVRAIKEAARPDDPQAELHVVHLDDVDFDHPALREFAAVDEVSLLKARTFTYALADTVQRAGAEVLASFTGGAPALVEAPLGKGRVMMLATTIDRDWSDLCIRTSFVPFVEQALLHLGGKLDQEAGGGHRLGEVALVKAPEGEGPLVLERPDATEVEVPEPGPEDGGRAQIPDLDLAGHYTLRRRLGRSEPTTFAVNADRAESDLAPADPEAVRALLGKAGSGVAPAPAVAETGGAAADPPDVGAADSRRTRVWPWILLGLFWLLVSEAWLVIRS